MEEYEPKYKPSIYLRLELVIWMVFSCVVGVRVFYAAVVQEPYLIFRAFYFDLLLSFMVLLFPYLFKLIYAEYPFQLLRNRRLRNISKMTNSANNLAHDLESKTLVSTDNSTVISNSYSDNDNDNDVHILENYLKQSQRLSEQILSRSSAYLLIGCLIAFAGVVFFYFQSVYIHSDSKLNPSELGFTFSETLPRLGVLIFVESIAFFFLKQYKATMEEFRYYEAIKRQRENQFFIYSFGDIYKDNPEYFSKLISNMNFSNNPNLMLKDETTQILEAQKLSTTESDVIDKFIGLLNIIKSK